MLKSTPILLVGCGNMGSAFLHGIFGFFGNACKVFVISPSGKREGVKHLPFTHCRSFDELAQQCPSVEFGCVILAVKPQKIDEVLPLLKPLKLAPGCVVLSILAGVELAHIDKAFVGSDVRCARAMPNIAVSSSCGVVAFFSLKVTPDELPFLDKMGRVIVADKEDNLHFFTAICGSGTGFAFYLMEAYTKAALSLAEESGINISKLELEAIVADVFSGACKLRHDDTDFANLKRSVTSARGTTEAGLSVMEGAFDAEKVFLKSFEKAARRSIELAEMFKA